MYNRYVVYKERFFVEISIQLEMQYQNTCLSKHATDDALENRIERAERCGSYTKKKTQGKTYFIKNLHIVQYKSDVFRIYYTQLVPHSSVLFFCLVFSLNISQFSLFKSLNIFRRVSTPAVGDSADLTLA